MFTTYESVFIAGQGIFKKKKKITDWILIHKWAVS